MCSRSRDLLKFWDISNNISETVQDRDVVATEVYSEIVCVVSKGTIASALE